MQPAYLKYPANIGHDNRSHMDNNIGIRLQGIEMLAAILNHVSTEATNIIAPNNIKRKVTMARSGANTATVSEVSLSKNISTYPGNGGTSGDVRNTGSTGTGESTDNTAAPDLLQDSIHQLLLHGAASLLVRALAYSISSKHEMSIRRSIYMIKFLMLHTPHTLAGMCLTYSGFAFDRCIFSPYRPYE